MADLLDDLLDQIALRLRHVAAMDTIQELRNEGERAEMLVDVIAPRDRLLEASLAAAEQELERKQRGTVAA